MRTFFAVAGLLFCLQCCISCQKQLWFDPVVTPIDSLVLIKTLTVVQYDTANVFMSQEKQTFVYDSILNRTVVTIQDSGKNSPGVVQQWAETFQYDALKRLVQFSSTSTNQPAAQIDFSYDITGNISKAAINDLWVGRPVECFFKTAMLNGQKTITMYDTTGTYINNSDTRPQITTYTFDAGNRITQEKILYTIFKRTENKLEDTTSMQFAYDNNNAVSKQVVNYAYRFDQNSSLTDYARDSTVYTREGDHTDIKNSFLQVYKNMYWFTISENPEGFANTLNLGAAIHSGAAIKTSEFCEFYPPDPLTKNHHAFTCQNLFDIHGLLVKSTFPAGFANKNGGKTELYYSWLTIRK